MPRVLASHLYVLALLALGCGDTGAPPGATLELTILAHSSKPDVATAGAGSGVLAVERAMAALTRVELVGCGNIGPIATSDHSVDLLADPAFKLLFDTAVIDYCGLRVSLGPVPDAAAELGAGSIHLAGTRSDGLPFDLSSALAEDFELSTSPTATPFDASQLILGFDLGVWFDTVDVQGAVVGPEDVVRLDEAQLTAFEARTNLALGLFLDNDGDGELDPDELSKVATSN